VNRYHALQIQPGNESEAPLTTGATREGLGDRDIKGKVMDGFPEFGKGMLKYWKFADGCELPMNNPGRA
jgi:hypothetical protein